MSWFSKCCSFRARCWPVHVSCFLLIIFNRTWNQIHEACVVCHFFDLGFNFKKINKVGVLAFCWHLVDIFVTVSEWHIDRVFINLSMCLHRNGKIPILIKKVLGWSGVYLFNERTYYLWYEHGFLTTAADWFFTLFCRSRNSRFKNVDGFVSCQLFHVLKVYYMFPISMNEVIVMIR